MSASSSPLSHQRLTGERALFGTADAVVTHSVFADGESPLKESSRSRIEDSSFQWKYPLWYAKGATVRDSVLTETARSGIWYSTDVRIIDSTIDAPKTFRRAQRVSLERVDMPRADETFWNCEDVTLDDVSARGDYFAMNTRGICARNLRLTGNYAFDGASDVVVEGGRIVSKDAFWNCTDVTVRGATIIGEYLGWNSRNLVFEDCTITSLQALCYVDGLTLRNCRFVDTTLAFEYSTVDATIDGRIDSVFNPAGGTIRAAEIGELVLDPAVIDPSATQIVLGEAGEDALDQIARGALSS